ncbi:MAG: hypothetical protein QXT45_05540 [Candidatus Bilamarchaeaceae archaeon]
MTKTVLLLTQQFNRNKRRIIGGTEKRIRLLNNYLNSNDFESEVLEYKTKKEIENFIKEKKYDVIINLPKEFYRLKDNSFIIQIANFTESYNQWADVNVAISKHDLHKFFLLKIAKKGKIAYIPNFIFLEKKASKRMYKKQLPNEIVIGRLARKEPSKWSPRPFLLALFGLFYSKKPITFLFVGLPFLYKLLFLLALPILKLKKINVKTYDEIFDNRELSGFYSSLDIFLQTSDIGESFGNVIIESFYFGVPVISDIKFALYPKPNKELYDAQVEHISIGKTGWIFVYPSSFFEITNNINVKDLKSMRKRCINYSKNYEISKIGNKWRELILKGKILTENVELLSQEFKLDYLQKIEQISKMNNNISFIEKIVFNISYFLLEVSQTFYIGIRKMLRFLRVDIESINFDIR